MSATPRVDAIMGRDSGELLVLARQLEIELNSALICAGVASKERGEWASQMREAAQAIRCLTAALQMAVRQNSHDMVMTGDEIRVCEGALALSTQPYRRNFLA